MRNLEVGKAGEDFACRYLMSKGYVVLHRNYRSGHLETDIICENDTHILFVEVKSRMDTGTPSRYGRPIPPKDRISDGARRLIFDPIKRTKNPAST